jgi:drug/metabolite transporter (DMT)-like permease
MGAGECRSGVVLSRVSHSAILAIPMTRRNERAAFALLLVAPAMFASNMLMARALHGSVPPVALAFWRWTLTFLVLLPLTGRQLLIWRGAIRHDWLTLFVLGALGMGVCGAPVYIAGVTTSATNIGLIYAASPILIVLLGCAFWGETLAPRQLVGIVASLLGVLVIVARGDPEVLRNLAFTRGDLISVGAATAWSVYSVLLKHRPSPLPLLARFAAIVLFGVLANLPFYIIEMATGRFAVFDARTLGSIVFVALVPGLGAYLSYGKLVAVLGPSRTGLLMYLVPVYTAALAWLTLGERLQLFHLAGLTLILPGIYLATRAPSKTT